MIRAVTLTACALLYAGLLIYLARHDIPAMLHPQPSEYVR